MLLGRFGPLGDRPLQEGIAGAFLAGCAQLPAYAGIVYGAVAAQSGPIQCMPALDRGVPFDLGRTVRDLLLAEPFGLAGNGVGFALACVGVWVPIGLLVGIGATFSPRADACDPQPESSTGPWRAPVTR